MPDDSSFVYDEDADIDESGTDSYIEQDRNVKQVNISWDAVMN